MEKMAVEEQLNQVEALYEELLNSTVLRSRKSTDDGSAEKKNHRSRDLFSDSKESQDQPPMMNPITEREEDEEEETTEKTTRQPQIVKFDVAAECNLLQKELNRIIGEKNLTIKDLTFKVLAYYCKYRSLVIRLNEVESELTQVQSELEETIRLQKESETFNETTGMEDSLAFQSGLQNQSAVELCEISIAHSIKFKNLSNDYVDKLDSIHKNIINQLVLHIYGVFVDAVEEGESQTRSIELFKERLLEKISRGDSVLSLNLENYDQ